MRWKCPSRDCSRCPRWFVCLRKRSCRFDSNRPRASSAGAQWTRQLGPFLSTDPSFLMKRKWTRRKDHLERFFFSRILGEIDRLFILPCAPTGPRGPGLPGGPGRPAGPGTPCMAKKVSTVKRRFRVSGSNGTERRGEEEEDVSKRQTISLTKCRQTGTSYGEMTHALIVFIAESLILKLRLDDRMSRIMMVGRRVRLDTALEAEELNENEKIADVCHVDRVGSPMQCSKIICRFGKWSIVILSINFLSRLFFSSLLVCQCQAYWSSLLCSMNMLKSIAFPQVFLSATHSSTCLDYFPIALLFLFGVKTGTSTTSTTPEKKKKAYYQFGLSIWTLIFLFLVHWTEERVSCTGSSPSPSSPSSSCPRWWFLNVCSSRKLRRGRACHDIQIGSRILVSLLTFDSTMQGEHVDEKWVF